MSPDTLSIILRGASFIALFQASGTAIFLRFFGRRLHSSVAILCLIIRLAATIAAVLLIGQYALEAARMADDMAGILDPSLQMLAMHSARSVVLGARLFGLFVIVMLVGRRGRVSVGLCLVGSSLVAGSFALTGHTVNHPLRFALAPLLIAHVTIVAFWFGALVPLYVVCRRETIGVAGQVAESFSKVALWLVPGILVAGLLMGFLLIHHVAALRSGYGLSLLAKILGFAGLMGLAALNKWRLGPAITAGDASALRWFRRSLAAEYGLIAVVLGVTALMTTLYSPEP